jgi:tRNA 5-methylaminomethyl-2-thiouridine biosynthesis bifunctional protein
VLGEAQVVVLTNAFDALRLLGEPDWPVHMVRGQVSMAAYGDHHPMPQLPITGAGYVLPGIDGQLLFGATSQRHDPDPALRLNDHSDNAAQLLRLIPTARYAPHTLQGRTGWRCVADDKLPVMGAVPDLAAFASEIPSRCAQARWVPRRAGLYVFTALGSRGITWSALGAQVMASTITGSPMPIENDLLDAVDPARFIARRIRQNHPN